MTSDGEALFRAICEQPWENTPRLVYADWLDENGDPERAEFIRVQIEAERTQDRSARTELLARAGQLHQQSGGRWTRGSPTRPGVRIGRDLRRGFYHEVEFEDAEMFGEHAERVFSWTPIDSLCVRRLTTSTLPDVLRSPYLGRLESLTLGDQFGDAGCDVIAETPHLSRLKELKILGGLVHNEGALALARSPHLAAVRSLRLSRVDHLNRQTLLTLRQRFDHFGTG
jgi:uncharacterized protein (TIGR02996 family)